MKVAPFNRRTTQGRKGGGVVGVGGAWEYRGWGCLPHDIIPVLNWFAPKCVDVARMCEGFSPYTFVITVPHLENKIKSYYFLDTWNVFNLIYLAKIIIIIKHFQDNLHSHVYSAMHRTMSITVKWISSFSDGLPQGFIFKLGSWIGLYWVFPLGLALG